MQLPTGTSGYETRGDAHLTKGDGVPAPESSVYSAVDSAETVTFIARLKIVARRSANVCSVSVFPSQLRVFEQRLRTTHSIYQTQAWRRAINGLFDLGLEGKQ